MKRINPNGPLTALKGMIVYDFNFYPGIEKKQTNGLKTSSYCISNFRILH